jgi:hypothetical protein
MLKCDLSDKENEVKIPCAKRHKVGKQQWKGVDIRENREYENQRLIIVDFNERKEEKSVKRPTSRNKKQSNLTKEEKSGLNLERSNHESANAFPLDRACKSS